MRVAILTVSDRAARGERADQTGPALQEFLHAAGAEVVTLEVVPDERPQIAAVLRRWCANDVADLILTNGGTGFAPRDVTPEATAEVIERPAPGIPEAIRAASLKITPRAMLSRATAGIRGRSLIINLPGSPTAARECLEAVLPTLPHAVELLRGEVTDCAQSPIVDTS